jgi:hypothetical protein
MKVDLSNGNLDKIKNYEYIGDLKNEFEIIDLMDDEKEIINGSIENDLIDQIEVSYGMFNEVFFY